MRRHANVMSTWNECALRAVIFKPVAISYWKIVLPSSWLWSETRARTLWCRHEQPQRQQSAGLRMAHATAKERLSSLFGSPCIIVDGGWHFCHRKWRQSWSMTITARARHRFVARSEFQSSSASRYCTNYSKMQCVRICVFEHTGFFG
jgi:hypothetical protein